MSKMKMVIYSESYMEGNENNIIIFSEKYEYNDYGTLKHKEMYQKIEIMSYMNKETFSDDFYK